MGRRFPHKSFAVSAIGLAAVALALTFGVSGAQAAAGFNDWWEIWESGGSGARAVAIQPDGKIVASGGSMLARFTSSRGHSDASFGNGGAVTTDFFSAAVAIQKDGEIVVAGDSDAQGLRSDFALARYTKNGALDTSFGTSGTVLTDFDSASDDFATAVAIQPDGKIVVAGFSHAHGRNSDFALARYTASGKLDEGFGAGGKVLTGFGPSASGEAYGVAIQPNGRIVVLGSTTGHKLNKFALARYTTSGTLDKSFGSGGKVLTGFRHSKNSSAKGVAIQKNGKIVAVGHTHHAKRDYFALARYTRRGKLDPRFGTDGRVLTGFGTSIGDACAVAIQPDGKIVAAGSSRWSGYRRADVDCHGDNIALARYTTSGKLDKGFGKGGRMDEHFELGSYYGAEDAAAVAIQPNGGIVTAGTRIGTKFLLARYFGR